jgi:hypothetical protein
MPRRKKIPTVQNNSTKNKRGNGNKFAQSIN